MHRTPMHWAASQNAREACSFLVACKCKLCPAEVSELLVSEEAGGTRDGKMGMLCATGKQMLDMRDEEGKTPADCANAKGHISLAQALEYERGGVRATVVTPTSKKVLHHLSSPFHSYTNYVIQDDEKTYQFLSSFLPFVCIIFLAMPYLPYWGLAISCVAAVMMHMSGRVVHWSNKNRTMVPAGLLVATMLGMIWCTIKMNYCIPLSLFSPLPSPSHCPTSL